MRLAIGGYVLFQEEGGQLLAQVAGQVLPLCEGDQLILVGLGEHPLERLAGTLEPTFAKCLPILAAQNGRPSMVTPPKGGRNVSSCREIMLAGKSCRRNGNAP